MEAPAVPPSALHRVRAPTAPHPACLDPSAAGAVERYDATEIPRRDVLAPEAGAARETAGRSRGDGLAVLAPGAPPCARATSGRRHRRPPPALARHVAGHRWLDGGGHGQDDGAAGEAGPL